MASWTPSNLQQRDVGKYTKPQAATVKSAAHFAALGYNVTTLHRTHFGSYNLSYAQPKISSSYTRRTRESHLHQPCPGAIPEQLLYLEGIREDSSTDDRIEDI
ncbi:hypothetical protein IPL68_05290 [Candidatus Saccharibacteria bacterium]|nr:MAG: hypothetical protein IPL68_05290 [Candidatus Saccharibacteria bacterium]